MKVEVFLQCCAILTIAIDAVAAAKTNKEFRSTINGDEVDYSKSSAKLEGIKTISKPGNKKRPEGGSKNHMKPGGMNLNIGTGTMNFKFGAGEPIKIDFAGGNLFPVGLGQVFGRHNIMDIFHSAIKRLDNGTKLVRVDRTEDNNTITTTTTNTYNIGIEELAQMTGLDMGMIALVLGMLVFFCLFLILPLGLLVGVFGLFFGFATLLFGGLGTAASAATAVMQEGISRIGDVPSETIFSVIKEIIKGFTVEGQGLN